MINSAVFVIIYATSFALAQTATSESSSVAIIVSLQATLQPQWRSSEHAWLASDRSVQNGTHTFVLVFHSQPHSLRFERYCFQIKAATSGARLMCWNKAFLIGGMQCRDLKLLENISFLASFTNSALQFLRV